MRRTIYALVDPRNGLVRWVGRTRNLHARLAVHLSRYRHDPNLKLRGWLDGLRDEGLQPTVVILDRCDLFSAGKREAEFIQAHAATAFNILRPDPVRQARLCQSGTMARAKFVRLAQLV